MKNILSIVAITGVFCLQAYAQGTGNYNRSVRPPQSKAPSFKPASKPQAQGQHNMAPEAKKPADQQPSSQQQQADRYYRAPTN